MGRSTKIREAVRAELRALLSVDMRAGDVLLALHCNPRTARKALAEIGGEIYSSEGRWWWTLNKKGGKCLRDLERMLDKGRGSVWINEARAELKYSKSAVREAVKELGLKTIWVGRKAKWVRREVMA